MNKIIGLISVWGAENWIKLSIKQALLFCDEVIVNVGSYVENLKNFEDDTLKICKSYEPKITIVSSIYTGVHATGKAASLNKALEVSNLFEVGNWIWLFDVDEYYLENEIKEVKNVIFSERSSYNAVEHNEMYFFINLQKYLKTTRIRLWKIDNKNHCFIPTNKWSGGRNRIFKNPGIGSFHYSTMKDYEFKKQLHLSEYNSGNNASKSQINKIKWIKEIYSKYDLENEEYWIEENRKLFGSREPYMKNTGFSPDKNGKLFTYTGKHPKLIEDAGLTKIKDFRKC